MVAQHVLLRARDSDSIAKIPLGKELQQLAMRWNYIVRQRNRWMQQASSRQRQSQRLQSELQNIGLKASHLKRLAECGIVEVSVPFETESRGWEARVMPWEYVLTAATAEYRGEQKLLVIRHLQRSGAVPKRRDMRKLAIIEAAPGVFREHYDFAAENRLVRNVLTDLDTRSFIDPTDSQLREGLANFQPDLIHLTGIDGRLGRRLLGEPAETHHSQDGVFLSGNLGETVPVNAWQMAALLAVADRKPELVGFNMWDSGSRLAALTVAQGAGAALGLENTLDDAVAELFFVNFYRACVGNAWDYLTAFLAAWKSLAPHSDSMRGSSIILWSARSLVGNGYEGFDKAADQAQAARQRRLEAGSDSRVAHPDWDRASELVQVTVRPKKQLNYALLHNGASIVDEFVLRFVPQPTLTQTTLTHDAEASDLSRFSSPRVRSAPTEAVGQVRDLHVTVELHVGTDSFPYRTTVKVGTAEERVELNSSIRLPLTSLLFRGLSERTLTSLFVEVRWYDQVLYRDTHSVWLSPIDEWSLVDEELCWLPSFVQPRDPEVARLIGSAQNFLKCLADYGSAGFDGYQSHAPEDPHDAWQGVDRQVRALWSALVFARELHYINPPPSYLSATQRLRTPRETVEQGRGTCLDLALLFAACLEWIDVYPVIFLLDDHAFPGYWKSLEAYQRFFDVRSELPAADELELDKPGQLSARWIAQRSTYREIKSYVDRGDLIPLESILLTTHSGFSEAIAAGREHFANRRNAAFYSMVDIFSARDTVTPLPLDYGRVV